MNFIAYNRIRHILSPIAPFGGFAMFDLSILLPLLLVVGGIIGWVVWKRSGSGEVKLKSKELPYLIQCLSSANAELRRKAVGAIRPMGIKAKKASPALRKTAQEDDERSVRFNAALALLAVDPESATAGVSALAEGAKSADMFVRKQAVESLAMLARRSKDALAALALALKDDSYIIRIEAAKALAMLGAAAAPVEEELTLAIKDRDERVCEAARAALEGIRNPASGKFKVKVA